MRRRGFIAAVGGAATWPAARDVCAERPVSTGGTFTFRTSITCAVTLFMVALAGLLIAIQTRALDLATREAASAYPALQNRGIAFMSVSKMAPGCRCVRSTI